MSFFEQHPMRQSLNDEVHARPPVPLTTPEYVTYLAFCHQNGSAEHEISHLTALTQQLGLPTPDTTSGHCYLDAGTFRLKWERHTEFSSYTFFRHITPEDTDDVHAMLHVPEIWKRDIPGQLIAATHIELRSASETPPEKVMAQVSPYGKTLVAAQIANGSGWLFTDFHLREGFSHFLLLDAELTPRQAGRTIQRLVEIETYRIMALLAFPVAKKLAYQLSESENELANLVDYMARPPESGDQDDHIALTQITRLAASVERSIAHSAFRFGAAAAYYRLVQQRIDELRETRINGFPTIQEFMERRLSPAINTCSAVAARQKDLSQRIARSAQLLRTRVDIELKRQHQDQLIQMNHRATLQLRLQETVEGLSIVAITYYASQLISYIAKGFSSLITPVTPEIITACSIPVIALITALSLRRLRKSLTTTGDGHQNHALPDKSH